MPWIDCSEMSLVIDLDDCSSSEASTPTSSVPSTPTSESSAGLDSHFPVSKPKGVLEGLLDAYRFSLRDKLPVEEQSICEHAVLDYLHGTPVTADDAKLLVPEFNKHPFVMMNRLAKNVGFFYSHGKISETELEEIYTHLITLADPRVNMVFEKCKAAVDRFLKNENQKTVGKNLASRTTRKQGRANAKKAGNGGGKKEKVCTAATGDQIIVHLPKCLRGNTEVPCPPPAAEELSMHNGIENDEVWSQNKRPASCVFEKKMGEAIVVRLPGRETKRNRRRINIIPMPRIRGDHVRSLSSTPSQSDGLAVLMPAGPSSFLSP